MMLQGGAVWGANCHLQCLEEGWRGVKNLFLFNRFSRWENHTAIPEHLGTTVLKVESTPNMKLGKLDTLYKLTWQIPRCQKKRSEHFNCLTPSRHLCGAPKRQQKSRIASTDGCGISNHHTG